MDFVKSVVHRESWDVDKRLAELGLTRNGLLVARDIAIQESANATSFHPANAAGTFSYHHGTWAIRHEFVGKDGWADDRVDGIEAIRNDTLKIKVAFCNVDIACNDQHWPKPRSKKGAGAERASGGGGLFADLPHYAEKPSGEFALFYLMVDEQGAAELTRPVVKGGTFESAVERIYLSNGSDDDRATITGDDTGPVDNFDPQVVRK
jgi:hypothetical protein